MSTPVTIRQATIEDAGLLLEFIKGLAVHVRQLDLVTASEEKIRNTLFAENCAATAFIAHYKAKPAGFVLYFKTYSTFSAQPGIYIEDLFVAPDFRGCGVGSSLLEFVFEEGRRMKAKKVEWYVNNANEEAIRFYRKVGAKVLDYKSIYYFETGPSNTDC